MSKTRHAAIHRKTAETDIAIKLAVDGHGASRFCGAPGGCARFLLVLRRTGRAR